MEAWDPGSSRKMMSDIVEKVPQLQGKSCGLMAELIDEIGLMDG